MRNSSQWECAKVFLHLRNGKTFDNLNTFPVVGIIFLKIFEISSSCFGYLVLCDFLVFQYICMGRHQHKIGMSDLRISFNQHIREFDGKELF